MLRESKGDKRNAGAGSYATFSLDGGSSRRQKRNASSLVVTFHRRCGHGHQARPPPTSVGPPEHAHYSAYAAHEPLHLHMCRNISFRENKSPGGLHLVTRRSTIVTSPFDPAWTGFVTAEAHCAAIETAHLAFKPRK
jgi:hypothetical protein